MARERRLDREIFFRRVVLPEQGAHARAQGGSAGFGCAEMGVHQLVPGLTGWAQINGRDELPIPEKAQLDAAYLANMSLTLDILILRLTFLKVLRRDGVSH